MQNIEVELKFLLNNGNKLKEKLNAIAVPGKVDEYQKDAYFVPAHRDFLNVKPIAEWIRLRQSPKGTSINYKNWLYNGWEKAVACDEFETKLESFDQMEQILLRLDFKQIIIVEKKRTTRQYGKAEIALDEVTDLWTYIEIEAKGEFENKESAIEYVYQIAQELEADLGEQDFRGYPYRLLAKQGYDF